MRLLRSTVIFIIAAAGFWLWLQSRPVGLGPDIDPVLEPHVNAWQELMLDQGLDVSRPFSRLRSIDLTDLEPGIAGVSHIGANRIRISDQVLDLGDFTLRAAVYHELGHSVFGLKHSDEISIMYYQALSESYYQQNWNELENEYVLNCKRNEFELKLR
jgi:hypothetical protein